MVLVSWTVIVFFFFLIIYNYRIIRTFCNRPDRGYCLARYSCETKTTVKYYNNKRKEASTFAINHAR